MRQNDNDYDKGYRNKQVIFHCIYNLFYEYRAA